MKLSTYKVKIMRMIDPVKEKNTDEKAEIKLDGKIIDMVKEHRFLGVFYDSQITFIAHIDHIMKETNNRTKPMANA